MPDLTLNEVAERTGQSLETIRKHAQRGKLVTSKSGTSVTVSEAAFDAYLAASGLRKAADKVERTGKVREAGNILAKLPDHVARAILDGLPTSKKPGNGEMFKKATRNVSKNVEMPEPSDEDPHNSAPIGWQWSESPRWKRVDENSWKLGSAVWRWNGLAWEGSGTVEGRMLGDGISPASPYSDKRPMEPSKAVTK